MSVIDPVAALLAELVRPVAPRLEFADELSNRFLKEGHPPAWTGVRGRRRVALDRLLPGLPPRLRIALVFILLSLLLGGIATATYLAVRPVYRTPPTTLGAGGEDQWSNFALAPGGHALYAIRVPRASAHPGTTQLVRIDDIDRSGALRPKLSRELDFEPLASPGFKLQTGSVAAGVLTVAANGSVFLTGPSRDPTRAVVYMLRPDGSHRRILDGSELTEATLFPATGGVSFKIAASAPDRVWLLAEPWEGDSPQRLFEIVDPNRDGDWSDRVVRPIVLPDSLPFAKRWRRRSWKAFPDWQWQLAAEPSLPGDDRSRSILAAALSHATGELRIYRLSDLNDDGDLLDPGEIRQIFDRPKGVPGQYPLDRSGVPPQIEPLVVPVRGVAHRSIAVAGLTNRDRVSLISDSGAITEIGRAFPNDTNWPANGLSIVANTRGDLYSIVATRSQRGLIWTVYRLEPGASVR